MAYLTLPGIFSARVVTPTDCYSYARLERDLARLLERFPRSLKLMEYGKSREGRSLFAAVVGDINAEHAILIQAGIHGREHMTTTLVMAQLERLLRCGVPKDVCFYMLPSTNPDGAHISQTLQSTPQIDAMFQEDVASGRFNRSKREYLREWKANAAGVDLNRNFDALWEKVRTTPAPSNQNYRGPYPESEPETRALVDITRSRRFDATISYHATGSEIYYAFSDDENVNSLGYSLALCVNTRLCYEIKPDSGLSFGGYKDWAIMREKVPSLTIEIGRSKTPLPMSEWRSIWRENAALPYYAAKWVKCHAAQVPKP